MSCIMKEPINLFETSKKREKKPKNKESKKSQKVGILATILTKIGLLKG